MWHFLILAVFEYMLLNQKRIFSAENNEPNTPLNYDKGYEYRVKTSFAILVFLPMILIAGFRAVNLYTTSLYVGPDTGSYTLGYALYSDSIFKLDKSVFDDKASGFIIFSVLIKSIFGSDSTMWLLIIAGISGVCIAKTYQRYTSEIVLCAFLFFSSTDFHSWMMNGMRQFLTTAILFACFPLIQEKKYIKFIIITLLLYTVHSSCLIVIPFYLATLGKPFNKKTIVILVCCLLAVVFVGQFTNLFGAAMESTTYSDVVDEFEGDSGTSFQRVAFYSVPAILAIFFRKKIPDDVPEIIAVSINMSLITMGLYLVSMVTSGIYIGRLPIYFSLFNYILLPWEIRTFFGDEHRKLVNTVMIIVYIVFFFFQMKTWNML
jgi:transmembrane protein EpsG